MGFNTILLCHTILLSFNHILLLFYCFLIVSYSISMLLSFIPYVSFIQVQLLNHQLHTLHPGVPEHPDRYVSHK
jgi:hypothetical protein